MIVKPCKGTDRVKMLAAQYLESSQKTRVLLESATSNLSLVEES